MRVCGAAMRCLLGGSWDLVAADNCGYNPTYYGGNPYKVI